MGVNCLFIKYLKAAAKRVIGLVFLLLPLIFEVAKGQNVIWAQQFAGSEIDQAGRIAVSSRGVSFSLGQFKGALSNQNGTLNSLNNSFDIYLANYNRLGGLIWLKSFGGPQDETPGGLAVDNSENSVLSFSFRGSVTIGNTTHTASGTSEDMLITKLNFLGLPFWSVRISGPGDEKARAIGLDAVGNVYATFTFNRYLLVNGDTVKSRGDFDIAVLKLNQGGAVQWVRTIGAITRDNVNDLTVDADGNVTVAGFSTGRTFYDSTTALNGFGFQDAFVARYNTRGDLRWVRRWGGPMGDEAFSVGASRDGHLYVGGTFQTTAKFDSSITLTSNGFSDIFLAKTDTAGNLKWVKTIGNGTATELISQVAVSQQNEVYFIGSFPQSIFYQTFGITSAGRTDIMIGRLDSAGNMLALSRFGGTEADLGRYIAVDGLKTSYFTCSFQDTASFGSNFFTVTPGAGSPAQDVVIARLDSSRPSLQNIAPKLSANSLLVKVFPNPSDGRFWVEGVGRLERLILTDLTGRVQEVEIKTLDSRFELNIKKAKPGMYFLKGTIQNENFTVPIVITTTLHER